MNKNLLNENATYKLLLHKKCLAIGARNSYLGNIFTQNPIDC